MYDKNRILDALEGQAALEERDEQIRQLQNVVRRFKHAQDLRSELSAFRDPTKDPLGYADLSKRWNTALTDADAVLRIFRSCKGRICELCLGDGFQDQRVGGEPRASNARCPDCDGLGWVDR